MEEIAKELIGTGATGLVVILGLYFMASLNKRQIKQEDGVIVAEFREVKAMMEANGKHLASIDEGIREFYKSNLDNKYKLAAIGEQLSRIEQKNV
jgi:hypothetical protein